ncbi:PRD domain-containing protein [Amedibacillus sp. YH-ame6]
MKVIKKINNNVAVCIDNNQNELIAFGKGIGFPEIPYELNDLSKIHRTYYGINSNYLGLLHEISEEVFEISARIVDFAKNYIDNELNANIVFTLADHINFAIQRYEKNLKIKMPFSYDVAHLYETEMEIGEKAVKLINEKMHIRLCKEEAVGIALHFINAENMQANMKDEIDETDLINELTVLIEDSMKIEIHRKGFNYSRFVSHLQYLLKRRDADTMITSDNNVLYSSMKKECPDTYACAQSIKEYILKHLKWELNQEELLYLMLHINRLCSREDCNH